MDVDLNRAMEDAAADELRGSRHELNKRKQIDRIVKMREYLRKRIPMNIIDTIVCSASEELRIPKQAAYTCAISTIAILFDERVIEIN